jgi:hypothetical protein
MYLLQKNNIKSVIRNNYQTQAIVNAKKLPPGFMPEVKYIFGLFKYLYS